MIEREFQLITSKFGPRLNPPGFHKGVDLRSREGENWEPRPAVAPEQLIIKRIVYQKKWGYTVVASGVDTGYTLKFTHLKKPDVKEGHDILPGIIIGWPGVTEYMTAQGYGEHLHFETWNKIKAFNPVKYFKQLNIPYKFKR